MIKAFLFEKFKGYDKAILWLEQITTLVGTNASGKSNAIEGMQILSELATGRDLSVIFDGTKNSEAAIRGGAKGCCRFTAKSFTLGCMIDLDSDHDLMYKVSIRASSRIAIEEESLYIVGNGSTDTKQGKLVFRTASKSTEDSGDISVEYANGKKGKNPQCRALRSMSILSQMIGKLPTDIEEYDASIRRIQLVQDSLMGIFILDPIPALMRNYSRIGDTTLRRNCSNVSSVLYALKDSDEWPGFVETISQLPENEIKGIDFVSTSLNDVILVQKEQNGSATANMEAQRLSDGTLRCIALLAAVMSEPKNSVIAIEELDNGIHPSRARKLMDALSRIASQRGIDLIITTHNVTLLNSLSKEDVLGVSVVYRDASSNASRIIPFVEIQNQAAILASGGIGDALETDSILRSIKEKTPRQPFEF